MTERIQRIKNHLLPPSTPTPTADDVRWFLMTERLQQCRLSPSPTAGTSFNKSDGMRPAGNGSNIGPQTENELRVDLAAAYRVVAHLGWDDGIQNHLTCKVPGTKNHFLINSYGMGFDEITASSLVKIDIDGNVVDPGSVAPAVNLAGFNIHGALHKVRHDAKCIMHTHEPHVAAMASMKCGFLPGLSQHAMICGSEGVKIHKYAPTTGPGGEEECKLLATSLGDEARTLLLENHGVLTCGETVAEAFTRLWYITKAAEIQVRALATPDGVDAVKMMTNKMHLEQMNIGGNAFFSYVSNAEFAHHRRIIDRVNPGYNDL